MRYRLQRHDGTDCSATMVPFTVLRLVPIQRYCHDLNELLKEIDDRLFKTVAFEEHSYTLAEMVHLIHYLIKRMKRQNNDENVFIYQELCIRLVSRIQHQWSSMLCKEPFAFSLYDYHVPALLYVMAELTELDFYQKPSVAHLGRGVPYFVCPFAAFPFESVVFVVGRVAIERLLEGLGTTL